MRPVRVPAAWAWVPGLHFGRATRDPLYGERRTFVACSEGPQYGVHVLYAHLEPGQDPAEVIEATIPMLEQQYPRMIGPLLPHSED